MEIRFAKPEDTTGILALLRQIGEVHHAGRPDIFQKNAQKFGASQVLSLLSDPDAPLFVAVEGEKVLGYCICEVKRYKNDPVVADHSTFYIEDLCVDAACRGQKIGTLLMEKAKEYARWLKCGSITLNVWAFNQDAIRFYESFGMKPQKIGMELILEEG